MAKENSTATRNLPRLSAQGARFATILVGPEKKSFIIHQDLLTYYSPFFGAALTGEFKEAKDKTINLQEDDPLIFEFFVHWLYHKGLPAKSNAPVELLNDWDHENDNGGVKTGNLIHLYVLGDKYDIAELKLLALSTLFLHMESIDTGLPSCSQISYAFENLPVGSVLLRYLVDSYCHYAGAYLWQNRTAHDFPSAFLDRVLSRYADYMHSDRTSCDDLDLCSYHNHKNNDEKINCPWFGTVSEIEV